jgi:hypothetical protein
MESYTFAGTSAHRYRIVDGQKFQIHKMQASLRYLSNNWCSESQKQFNCPELLSFLKVLTNDNPFAETQFAYRKFKVNRTVAIEM